MAWLAQQGQRLHARTRYMLSLEMQVQLLPFLDRPASNLRYAAVVSYAWAAWSVRCCVWLALRILLCCVHDTLRLEHALVSAVFTTSAPGTRIHSTGVSMSATRHANTSAAAVNLKAT